MWKSKNELNEYSFHPIYTYFSNLSFGGCPQNVYSGTPTEILHVVLLGLCKTLLTVWNQF